MQRKEDKQDSPDGNIGAASRKVITDMRYEAYMALIDYRIRNAYVRSL